VQSKEQTDAAADLKGCSMMNPGRIDSELARTFSFGPFHLNPAQRLLLEGEKPVHLGSRALEILIALVERHGELVTKEH
jgi:DNA-binding response OmpR family regulator